MYSTLLSEQLPMELVTRILHYLPLIDRMGLAGTCRNMQRQVLKALEDGPFDVSDDEDPPTNYDDCAAGRAEPDNELADHRICGHRYAADFALHSTLLLKLILRYPRIGRSVRQLKIKAKLGPNFRERYRTWPRACAFSA